MGRHAGAGEAHVARPGLPLVLDPGAAGDVDVAEDVVDDLAVAGVILDGADVFVVGQVGGDHEAAVDVLPLRGDDVVLGGLDDEVGRAQSPVGRERRGGAEILGLPFGRARLGPACQEGDLVAGERLGVLERRAEVGRRLPRGHHPLGGDAGDVDARFRACSYVSSANGPTCPGRWQPTQLDRRIGRDVMGVGRRGGVGRGRDRAADGVDLGGGDGLAVEDGRTASRSSLVSWRAFRLPRAANWSSIRPR